MGKQDSVQKVYWEDDTRFADLFNTIMGDGEELISASDLKEEGTNYSGNVTEGKKQETYDFYRDVIKKATKNMTCFLIGIENQSHVHYGMPVRVMVWDSMTYAKEMRQIQRKHRQDRDIQMPDEFLSGMRREERLKPVCTIVLYYGEKEWDGPLDLHDMLDLEGIPEKLQGKFVNYPMMLIDVHRFSEWDKFQTDLREVFGFIYHSNDEEQMERFVEENRERLSELPIDACDFIETVTGSKELKEFRQAKKGDEQDMCRALEQMKETARQKGFQEGVNEGFSEGRDEGIQFMAALMLEAGYPFEKICAKIIEKYGMTREEAEACIKS